MNSKLQPTAGQRENLKIQTYQFKIKTCARVRRSSDAIKTRRTSVTIKRKLNRVCFCTGAAAALFVRRARVLVVQANAALKLKTAIDVEAAV
ncbi:hypothetical protein EVAR_57776_1 [Eumeta japonica]|uniref:Uncharacterized protein n=1 Tax=Eumeta variegata TaxID=151549 RepID=A0A4C1Y513_EUMVA|nr:hypothetical protein EVAR_57776_1 [Eumeta japonica]